VDSILPKLAYHFWKVKILQTTASCEECARYAFSNYTHDDYLAPSICDYMSAKPSLLNQGRDHSFWLL